MIHRRRLLAALLAAALGPAVAGLSAPAAAQDLSITVASTTSTEDSGLFGHILPVFTKETGIAVKVVAQGTGQALETARRGDADVVLVHAKAQEEAFVADGFGVERFDVMYNDFVIVGPASDPAGIAGTADATAALKRIDEAEAPFVSRGDKSGTHTAELRLWTEAGLDPASQGGEWYRSIGQGMGAALNTASAMNAYVLADRATWLSFGNRGALKVLVEGDKRLFNQYGVILVSPRKHPHVKADLGQSFVDWLISPEGQATIANYRIDGQQLFFPNAPEKRS